MKTRRERLARLHLKTIRFINWALADKRPEKVRWRWLIEPGDLAGRDVVVFMTYDPIGFISAHARAQIEAWSSQAFEVLVVVNSDHDRAFSAPSDVAGFAGLMVRQNRGYDFGAWATAIGVAPTLRDAALLALANDSLLGPLDSFGAFLARVRGFPADVLGATESYEICHHLQSYLIFFKVKALKNKEFQKFWSSVRLGDREHIIARYELNLARRMKDAGLVVSAVFLADPAQPFNPTLTRWRELIASGFPFLKLRLLRDNPFNVDVSDWRAVVEGRGYRPELFSGAVKDGARIGAGRVKSLGSIGSP